MRRAYFGISCAAEDWAAGSFAVNFRSTLTLDFYCHDKKLAIELDGGQHNEPDGIIRDEVRKTFIEQRSIRILRFWNHEVLADREIVLQVIWDALQMPNKG